MIMTVKMTVTMAILTVGYDDDDKNDNDSNDDITWR